MKRVDKYRSFFSYDPKTGIFRWKKHRSKPLIGRVAGCRGVHGYWLITLNDKKTVAHKVAWALHYGYWPRFDIDHRDLDKGNNRISNLRRSNKSNNGANRPMQKNNTSGYKGVYWSAAARKWMVQIKARNTFHYVGLFVDKKEAAQAYYAKAVELFGEHARAA